MWQSRRGAGAGLAAVALLAGAAGCGGGDTATVAQPQDAGGPVTTSAPAATAPSVPAPSTTATSVATAPAPATTAPASTTTTAPTATTGVPTGESQPGGGGDEEPIRVPAVFRVRDGAIAPHRITVPAFLPVALAITSIGQARHVTIEAPGGGALDVARGGTARRVLPGLKPGDYAVVADGGGRATLHVTPGGDAGP